MKWQKLTETSEEGNKLGLFLVLAAVIFSANLLYWKATGYCMFLVWPIMPSWKPAFFNKLPKI